MKCLFTLSLLLVHSLPAWGVNSLEVRGGGVSPGYVSQKTLVTMLSLRATNTSVSLPLNLSLIAISLSGTVSPNDVKQIYLYRDWNNDGVVDVTNDSMLYSTTFKDLGVSKGWATLAHVNGYLDTIPESSSATYLIALSFAGVDNAQGQMVGLTIPAPESNHLKLIEHTLSVVVPSPLSTGIHQAVGGTLGSPSEAVFSLRGGEAWVGPPIGLSTIEPGTGAEWMRLFVAGRGNASWSGLALRFSGNTLIDAEEVSQVVLYRQGGGDLARLDGSDIPLASGIFNTLGGMTLTFTNPETITSSTRQWYLIGMSLKSTAPIGRPFGAQVDPSAMIFMDPAQGQMVSSGTVGCRYYTAVPTQSILAQSWFDVSRPALVQSTETAMLRVSLTNMGNSTTIQWSLVAFTLLGKVIVPQVERLVLIKDTGDGTFGTEDVSLRSATFVEGIRYATLGNGLTPLDSIPPHTTRVYFIALRPFSNTNGSGRTVGLSVRYLAYNTLVTGGGASTTEQQLIGTTSRKDAVFAVYGAAAEVGVPALTTVEPGSERELYSLFLAGGGTAGWTGLKLSYRGTDVNDVEYINLYRQTTPTNRVSLLDANDDLVAYTSLGADRTATLNFSAEPVFPTTRQWYLVTVVTKPTATLSNIVTFTLTDAGAFLMEPSTFQTSFYRTPVGSRSYTVTGAPTLTMNAVSMAPVWMTQGDWQAGVPEEAALMRLTLKTDQGQAVLQGIRINLAGSATWIGGHMGVKLYKDNGNGVWGATTDTLMASWNFDYLTKNAFLGSEVGGSNKLNEVIKTSPSVYFLVASLQAPAPNGTMRYTLAAIDSITVDAPGTVSSANFPLGSVATTIVDRADLLAVEQTFTGVTTGAERVTLLPSKQAAIMRFTLRVVPQTGTETAVWTGVRVSLTGNLPMGEIDSLSLSLSSSGSTLLAVRTSFTDDRWVTLDGFSSSVGTQNKEYDIRLTTKNTAEIGPPPGLSVGVAQIFPENFFMVAPDVGTTLAASPYAYTGRYLYVTLAPPVSLIPDLIVQGERTPLAKLSFWTAQEDIAYLTGFVKVSLMPGNVVTLVPAAGVSLVGAIALTWWADNGNGVWEPQNENGDVTLSGATPLMISSAGVQAFAIGTVPLNAPLNSVVGLTYMDLPSVSFSAPNVSLVSAVAGPVVVSLGARVADAADRLTLMVGNHIGASTDDVVERGSLRQGTKYSMLRITFWNNSGDDVRVDSLRVQVQGNVPPSDVVLYYYRESVDPSNDWAVADTILGSATVDSNRVAVFTGLNDTASAAQVKVRYLVAEALAGAPLNGIVTLGLSLDGTDPALMGVSPPDVVVANTASWRGTALYTLIGAMADFAEFTWDDDPAPNYMGSPDTVPFLRVNAFVGSNTASPDAQAPWTTLTCSLRGVEMGNGVKAGVRLYRDVNDNNVWENEVDSLVGEETTLSSIMTNPVRTLSLTEVTLTTSSVRYFVVVTMDGAALPGNALSVSLSAMSVGVHDLVWRLYMNYPTSTVDVDDPDVLTLSAERMAPAVTVPPLRLTQGTGGTFLRFTLSVKNGEEAIVTSLRVSLTGTLLLTGISNRSVFLFRDGGDDEPANGEYDGQDLSLNLGPSSGVFGDNRVATFIFNEDIPGPLAANPQTYFLRLSLTSFAREETTVGLTILSVTVFTPDTVAFRAYTSTLGSNVVTVTDLQDVAILNSSGINNLIPHGFIRQGELTPLAKFTLEVNNTERAKVTELKVNLTGNDASQVESVRLYRDGVRGVDGAWTGADGTWSEQDGLIKSVSSFSYPAVTFSALSETLEGSIAYFIVVKPSINAPLGQTLQLVVGGVGTTMVVVAPDIPNIGFAVVVSGGIVEPSADYVKGGMVNMAPLSLVVGTRAAVASLSLFTERFDARLVSLSLTSYGLGPLTQVTAYLYRDEYPFGTWSATGSDFLAGSATFTSVVGATFISFTNLSETIVGTPRKWFVVLGTHPSAPLQLTLGVSVQDAKNFGLAGTDRMYGFTSFVSNAITLVPAPPPPDTSPPKRYLVDAAPIGGVQLTQGVAAQPVMWLTLKAEEANTGAPMTTIRLSLSGDVLGEELIWDTGAGLYQHPSDILLSSSPAGSGRSIQLGVNLSVSFTSKIFRLKLAVSNAVSAGRVLGVALTGAGSVEGLGSTLIAASGGAVFPVSNAATVLKMTSTLRSVWSNAAPMIFLQKGRLVPAAQVTIERMSGGLPMTLAALRLSLSGTVSPLSAVTAYLYRDANADGAWQATDAVMSTLAGFDTGGEGTFSNLGLSLPLTGAPSLFVALRAGENAVLDSSVKIGGVGNVPGTAMFAAPDQESLAGSGFPITGFPLLTLVAADADEVRIAAFNQAPSRFDRSVEQALIKFSLSAVGGGESGVWNRLAVSLLGDADPSFVTLRLYRDNGNGVWEADKESLIAAMSAFTPDRLGTFDHLQTPFDRTNYFVRLSLAPLAFTSETLGVWVEGSWFDVAAPDRIASSNNVSISPRPIDAVERDVVTFNFLEETYEKFETSMEQRLFRVGMSVNGGDGAARWDQMVVSLTGILVNGPPDWDGSGVALRLYRANGELVRTVDTFSPERLGTFDALGETITNGVHYSVRLSLAAFAVPANSFQLGMVVLTSWFEVAPPDVASPSAGNLMINENYISASMLANTLTASPLTVTLPWNQGVTQALMQVEMPGDQVPLWKGVTLSLLGYVAPDMGVWSFVQSPAYGTWNTMFDPGNRRITISGPAVKACNLEVVFTPSEEFPVSAAVGLSLLADPAFVSTEPGRPVVVVPETGAGVAPVTIADSPDLIMLVGTVNQAPLTLSPGGKSSLLLLSMGVNHGSLVWTGFTQLSLKGSLSSSQVAKVWLYRESTGNSNWEAGGDSLLAEGILEGSHLTLGGMFETLTAGSTPRYYLAISLGTGATSGATIGVQGPQFRPLVANPDNTNIFTVASSLATVVGSGISAIEERGGSAAPTAMATGDQAALFRLSLRTDASAPLSVTGLRFMLKGDIDPDHVVYQVFRDDGPGGAGLWQNTDTPIGSPVTGRSAFSVGLAGTFSGLGQAVSAASPWTGFLVVSLKPSSPSGSTVRVSLPPEAWMISQSTVSLFPGAASSLVSVEIPDRLTVGGTVMALNSEAAQGSVLTPLWLTVAANQNTVLWSRLRLSLSGTLPPSQAAVRFVSTTLVPFGADRWATLQFNELQTVSPVLYGIQLSLSSSASPGSTAGLVVTGAGAFEVSAPDRVTLVGGSLLSALVTVTDVPDNVMVWSAAYAPGYVAPGTAVEFLRLSLYTFSDVAIWRSLVVEATGLLSPTLLSAKLYRDVPPKGVWDATDLLIGETGFDVNRFGTFAVLNETVDATYPSYSLVLSMSGASPPNTSVGVRVPATWAVGLATPDVISSFSNVGAASVTEPADEITVDGVSLAPGMMLSGSSTAMMRLTLRATTAGRAVWTLLKVSLTGTLPFGSVRMTLFRDGGNGIWEPSDDVVAGSVTFGATRVGSLEVSGQTISAAPSLYFLAAAHQGVSNHHTFGVTMSESDFAYLSPDLPAVGTSVGSSLVVVKDLAVVQAVVDPLGPLTLHQGDPPTPVFRLTLTTNQDETEWSRMRLSLSPPGSTTGLRLELYEDTGPTLAVWEPGGDASLTGAFFGTDGVVTLGGFSHTLTTTARRYFVVAVPLDTAPIGPLFLTLSTVWWTVGALDAVQDRGSGLSLTVIDNTDRLTVTAAQAGPATHRQNGERAYLALTLSVNQDEVVATTLTVQPKDSALNASWGAVKWYIDADGDGVWTPSDRQIALGFLDQGVVHLTPLSGLTIRGAPLTTFVTLHLSLNAPLNGTVGMSLNSQPVTVSGVDDLSAFVPFGSSVKTVASPTPLTISAEGADPAAQAIQGALRVAALRLTFDNHSVEGDYAQLASLTFAVESGSSVLASLWVEREGVPLGEVSGTGALRTVQFLPSQGFVGRSVWDVWMSIQAAAPLGSAWVTLAGFTVEALSVPSAAAPPPVGHVIIEDLPDQLVIQGADGPAELLAIGAPPEAFLQVTASLASFPQDQATLTHLTLSLTGSSPVGVEDPAFSTRFRVLVYRLLGAGEFSLSEATWVGSADFAPSRLAAVSLASPVSLAGEVTHRYYLALSLEATSPPIKLYGGFVGLSLVGGQAVSPDVVTVAGTTTSNLRRIMDRGIRVVGKTIFTAPALTLGGIFPAFGLTFSADRGEGVLRALSLSHRLSSRDDEWLAVQLYRERDGDGRWTAAGDESLVTATFVGGVASLGLEAGAFTVGRTSPTLWVVSVLDPWVASDRYFGLLADTKWSASSVVAAPITLATQGVVDGPNTLWAGVSDLSSPVAITGETMLALRLSLRAASGSVGVTRMGVRLISTNAEEFASVIQFSLVEGNRLLAEGRLAGSNVVQLNVTFGVHESIFEEPRHWDIYLWAEAGAPAHPFRLAVDATDLALVGPQDTVAANTLLTSTIRMISQWGFSTIRLTPRHLLEGVNRQVPRGTFRPLAYLDLATTEPSGIARLTALRMARIGQGLPGDVRVTAHLSRTDLAVFNEAQAPFIGQGRFDDRMCYVTLMNKPFITNAPRRLWLVAEIQPTALVGATWGVEVWQRSLLGDGQFEVIGDLLPFRTPLLTIEGSGVSSTLTAVITSASPATAIQGALSVTLGTMTLRALEGPGSVVTGLKVSLIQGGEALMRPRLMKGGVNVLRGATRTPSMVWLTLGEPVLPTPASYQLMADISPTVTPGTVVQVEVGSNDLMGLVMDSLIVNGGNAWRSSFMTLVDAPDQLTLSARPRPVPWEVSEWTPAFLITLNVDHDEAQLIRITLGSLGNWLTGELDNFRLRIGDTIISTVAQSLGGGLMQLSLVNYPVIKLSSYPVGRLELSLSPSINLTGTLGLSLLGVGVAPDPVTGAVVDTVIFAPAGTSLLGIRHPRQAFPPDLVIQTRYLKGVNALAATWTALVKQGAVSRYRYRVLSWKGISPDFEALTLSLTSYPLSLPLGWEGITPWMVTAEPRVVQEGLQLAHGMTLYIAVQAQGEDAPWSEVVFSQSILVDSQRPAFLPTPPGVVKGKKQMVLSWTTPESGPSGVERYVIERRRGTKPTWEVLVSAQAPRLDPPASPGSEEWSQWYPYSYGHLLTGESGNWIIDKPSNSPVNQLTSYPVGQAPALQLPSYQINKLINAPIETKLTPYLTSTSSILPLEDGTSYYRVKAVSGAGEESEPTVSTKVVAGAENLPNVLNEVSNYPNPFDSRVKGTTIVYVMNQDAPVTIRIYTVLGDLVKEWTFVKGQAGGQVGANEVVWTGENELGQKVTTGAYICVIIADADRKATVTRKIGVIH